MSSSFPRFAEFAVLCERLAATQKKLEKRASIAAFLSEASVQEAGLAAQYLSGQIFAETEGRVLNVAGTLLHRVLEQLSGATPAVMHAAFLRHGDMGSAAFELLPQNKVASLSLYEAESFFLQLAETRGQEPKRKLLSDLLARASALEAKYLVKIVLGDMRIGVRQSLVEEAIAQAFHEEIEAVRRASMLLGDLKQVVALAHDHALATAKMKLFHPIGFMLASPVASVEEAMDRFREEIRAETPKDSDSALSAEQVVREAQLEDKYDGIRCQLHAGDPEDPQRVVLFSRSKEDMTASFPELARAFRNISQPVVLDGEILAWDAAGDHAMPFSALQTRIGRKRVTPTMQKEVPVVFMAFDILSWSYETNWEQPLAERRALLEKIAKAHSGQTSIASVEEHGQESLFRMEEQQSFPRWKLSPAVALESVEQLESAYVEARVRGNEGVMLKALHSTYQPGRRGLAWLKLKRELATLDVVVTAAEYGHGKRAGVLSDYTFAVRDRDELKNIGKAYSGLTDAEIRELSNWFLEHTLEDYGYVRQVEPKIILEVAFNNVMRSTRHASGFALRFPRILRIRKDKPVEEIDTLERVEEIYASQPDKPVEA